MLQTSVCITAEEGRQDNYPVSQVRNLVPRLSKGHRGWDHYWDQNQITTKNSSCLADSVPNQLA